MWQPGRLPEVAIWDLDGTLVDSKPGIYQAAKRTFTEFGVPVPDLVDFDHFVGPPLAQSFANFGISAGQIDQAIAFYRGIYVPDYLLDCPLFPGVKDILWLAQERGVKLAVATSKVDQFAEKILSHHGLLGFFGTVSGATLDGTRTAKADILASALAAPELGYHPDALAVMVGDREHDLQAAAAHGMPGIGVQWGYGTCAELQSAGARLVVHQACQLRDALGLA